MKTENTYMHFGLIDEDLRISKFSFFPVTASSSSSFSLIFLSSPGNYVQKGPPEATLSFLHWH